MRYKYYFHDESMTDTPLQDMLSCTTKYTTQYIFSIHLLVTYHIAVLLTKNLACA